MKAAFLACVLILALTTWIPSVPAQQARLPGSHRAFDFLGTNVTILLAGAETGGTSATLKLRIPAHDGPPPHIHTRENEVYIIHSGTFQFFMDGLCLEAGPGASVYMPKGHTHTFKNISEHAGEQVLFVYPAGLEQFFLDVHELGLRMPQDFAKLNELSNSKYGINHLPAHDFNAGDCKKVGSSTDSGK